MSAARRDEFVSRDLPARYFFPHRLHYLRKCGPDALRLGRNMCGTTRQDDHWELLLHAVPGQIDGIPASLFFDDEIVWHRQHFGLPAHVAFAYLVVANDRVYGLNYVSDVVQRISRRRELKTRIEDLFDGWHHMVLNGILNFAVEHKLAKIYSPTSALIMRQTDRARTVLPALFERIYDRAVHRRWRATKEGDWWVIDVRANRDRLVAPVPAEQALPSANTICISHDIERGLGHLGLDDARVRVANQMAPDALLETLACEEAVGLTTTYNVVGCFFDEVRSAIESGGHCLAFHSYSHRVRTWWSLTRHYYRARRLVASRTGAAPQKDHYNQLYNCRVVDPRVRGFRPPQSRESAEWSDYNLVFHNFDWCASSDRALRIQTPVLSNRLVKIPVHFDDFSLFRSGMTFDTWRQQALRRIEASDFVVFGLHDCYADFWLPGYRDFLERIRTLGTFRTLDEIANEIILEHAA